MGVHTHKIEKERENENPVFRCHSIAVKHGGVKGLWGGMFAGETSDWSDSTIAASAVGKRGRNMQAREHVRLKHPSDPIHPTRGVTHPTQTSRAEPI